MNLKDFHVSKSTARRNPMLFGLGGLQDPKREQNQRSQSEHRELDKSTSGVGYRVTIISVRRKLVDGHDNLRWGAKPLVDSITKTLGFASDDNPRLRWDYAQIIAEPEATIVLISRMAKST